MKEKKYLLVALRSIFQRWFSAKSFDFTQTRPVTTAFHFTPCQTPWGHRTSHKLENYLQTKPYNAKSVKFFSAYLHGSKSNLVRS